MHARRTIEPDPDFELDLALHLKETYAVEALHELYARFAAGPGDFDRRMRRTIWRAMARRFGQGVEIGADVRFRHVDTFEIGDGVSIGDQVVIQGRIGGACVLGDRVWIGPQAFLDARALVIEAGAGLGPGVRILGSVHTGEPAGLPIMETALEIRPVRIGVGADIGMSATILPGVTIGGGAIVGAGATVTRDVPSGAIVVGVPARVIRWRDSYGPDET